MANSSISRTVKIRENVLDRLDSRKLIEEESYSSVISRMTSSIEMFEHIFEKRGK